MKYRLSHQWPVGSVVIPSGAIVDDDAESGWSTVVRGLVPPPDSIPLDLKTRAWLIRAYQLPDHFHDIPQVPQQEN
jgi:hypothetical protein